MSSIQRYLQMANRQVNESFIGVDGFVDDDMYFAAGDNFFGADGAEAAPMAAPAVMRSQPYILTVSNASNAAVTVDVFGAYIYLNNAGFSGNGNQATKILTPVIDPYQQQSGVIELKQPFRIDGFTKLTFSIFASTSIQFQFYPSDTINIARGLGGNAVSKQYGSPKIIRPAAR